MSFVDNLTIIFSSPLPYLVIFIVIFGILAVMFALKSPFSYPYFTYVFDSFDISNAPDVDKLIDSFLLGSGHDAIFGHMAYIDDWKRRCEVRANNSVLKSYRRRQFEKCLDDGHAFQFVFVQDERVFGVQDLKDRYNKLMKLKVTENMAKHTNLFYPEDNSDR